MNRGTLRSNVLSRRSWHADVDKKFEAEVNTVCIDGAIKRLAREVPEAFIPDEEAIYLYPDMTDLTLERTVAATVDAWVLTFGPSTGGEPIAVDGTLDGLYHIEAVQPDNTLVTYQCREFWLQSGGPYDGHYLVSLNRPWRNTTDTGMSFRLHQPYFYLRDNTTKLVDGRVFDTTRNVVTTLPTGFVRRIASEDYRGSYRGRPDAFARWNHFQLPAPNRTPQVQLDTTLVPDPWVGPMPPGKRKYRYTYVWGKRDFQSAAPGGQYEPLWESAPSPESATIDVADMSKAVQLYDLVNIDFVQGFGTTGTLRKGHSGWRKRIYVAISSVEPGAGTVQQIEYPDIYFFLDEVDGETTMYVDDGSVIPDYGRRIPESRGYYAWSAVPHQDAKYRVDLRVYRRPLSLLCDNDAPQVHPDFDDMLEDLVLARLCEMDKSPNDALKYEADYKSKVEEYRAAEASPADFVPAEPWRPTPSFDILKDPFYYTPYRTR